MMKKILMLLFAIFLGHSVALAQGTSTTDKVTIKSSTNKPLVLNGTDVNTYFTVCLEGSNISYTGYQMDIHIPDGMTIVTNKNVPKVNLGTSSSKAHSLYPSSEDVEETEDGEEKTVYKYTHSASSQINGDVLRVVCTSSQSEDLKAFSGELLRVYVKASAFMKPGDVDILIDNVVLTHNEWSEKDQMKHASSYKPSVACGGKITNVSGECNNLAINVSATNQWSTCILPFDAALPDGVKGYTCVTSDSEQNTVKLTPASSFAAYTPYILYSENGYSGTLSGTVDPNKYPAGGYVTEGLLNGAIVPQQVTQGYVLQNLSEGVKFYNCSGGGTFSIPAGKCWLSALSSDVKAFSFEIDDSTTDIETVAHKTKSDAIYNLNGQMVKKMKPGSIYIKNGNKILK